MATTQGEKALLSDLNSWQTIFDNLASQYSNGVSGLSQTSAGATMTIAQINNFHDRITKFRADKYLGTQAAWWPTGTNVIQGNPITPANLTAILGVVSNASKVKCKNIANNSSGSHSCGTKTNGADGGGNRTNGYNNKACTYSCNNNRYSNGQSCNSNGACSNRCSAYGTCYNGACLDGTHGNTKKTNGTSVLITYSCTTITQ